MPSLTVMRTREEPRPRRHDTSEPGDVLLVLLFGGLGILWSLIATMIVAATDMEMSSPPLMIRLIEYIVFWPPFCAFLIDGGLRSIGIEVVDPAIQMLLTMLPGFLVGALLGRLVRWRVLT